MFVFILIKNNRISRKDVYLRLMRAVSFIFLLTVLGSFNLGASQPGKIGPQESEGSYLGQKPPVSTPELFAPGIVSTSRDEHGSPVFTPDLEEAYWTVNVEYGGANITHVILGVRRESKGWSKPFIPEPCRRFAFSENPCLSRDGHRLYFNASDTFDPQRNVPTELYAANRTASGWGEARLVHFAEGAFPLGPSLSAQGTLFFYNSDRTDFSRAGLAFSTPVGEGFSAPILLDERLRTGRSTYTPWVAPDESWLIFASWREGGVGRCDLYISFKEMNGRWSDPVRLDMGISSEANERFPAMSPDGKYLYFLSNRTIQEAGPHDPGNGYGDVYWVSTSIIEDLRKKAIKNDK